MQIPDFDSLLRGKRVDILCLSDAPWDWLLWTNRQYAMSTLALDYSKTRVLYVESPSFFIRQNSNHRERWPSGAEIFSSRQGSTRFLRQMQERIWVLRPPLPLPSRFLRKRVPRLLWQETLWLLRNALSFLEFRNYLFVSYTPYAAWCIDRLAPVFSIYDCVDDHASAAFNQWDQDRMSRYERHLVQHVDIVVTASPRVCELQLADNPHTYNLGNPVNFDMFTQASTPLPRPNELRNITSPILGFYGALASYKVGLDLISELSKRHPEWHILLIGPINDNQERWFEMKKRQNVTLLEPMPQNELIPYIAQCAVLLLPYTISHHVNFISPLKLHEYFATGKPVVSTFAPSETNYQDLLYLADTINAFESQVAVALNEPRNSSKRDMRIALAKQNTWEHKVFNMLSIAVSHGLLNNLSN